MTADRTRVLIVDDDYSMCQYLGEALGRRGFDVTTRLNAEDAIDALAFDEFQVVVTDLQMQSSDGIELCKQLKDNSPDVPVVIMTGFGSQEAVVDAMRAGAYDFITKPFEIDLLQATVERADRYRRLHSEVSRLRRKIANPYELNGLLGQSRPMRALASLINQTAPTEASVLITGESGTGKELVARAIHMKSNRGEHPYIAINCGAMPEPLLESELFGHARGAFTDAKTAKEGLFAAANGGTIFLDEIGDMPVSIQVKLLRAIQERRVRPIGSTEEISFSARIITATNRDLDADVEEGRFRSDLFYRLNVVRIHVPPLRSRGNDVLLLAQHFLARSAEASRRNIIAFSRQAAWRLAIYPFPGNVRELENVVERAVALTTSSEIQLEDLPEAIRTYDRKNGPIDAQDVEQMMSLEELEKRYVAHVLRAVAGNKTQAAHVLHMDRKTLYRKLRRWRAAERSEPEAAHPTSDKSFG